MQADVMLRNCVRQAAMLGLARVSNIFGSVYQGMEETMEKYAASTSGVAFCHATGGVEAGSTHTIVVMAAKWLTSGLSSVRPRAEELEAPCAKLRLGAWHGAGRASRCSGVETWWQLRESSLLEWLIG